MPRSDLNEHRLAWASPQWHGLFLGIVHSSPVIVQKRFLVINSSSLFTLILIHIKSVAAARNTRACCLRKPSGVLAAGTLISSTYISLVISYSSIEEKSQTPNQTVLSL